MACEVIYSLSLLLCQAVIQIWLRMLHALTWPGRRAAQVPLLRRTAIDWGLMLTGIPLCLLARAANIFPLSAALNTRRRIPLPRNLQVRVSKGWRTPSQSCACRGRARPASSSPVQRPERASACVLVLQLRPTLDWRTCSKNTVHREPQWARAYHHSHGP